MYQGLKIKAPFFEIGPKNYLWGDDVVALAVAADEASKKYDVDIIFTTPLVELRRVKENTKHLHVFAPHMDSLKPGRGLAEVLPEMLVAAGAEGVSKGLAVHSRRDDRKHRRLRAGVSAEKAPQSRNTGDGAVEAIHQRALPLSDVLYPEQRKIADAGKKPGDPGHVVGARLQTVRQEFRHGL